MSIWIVTTGSSDVQLKSNENWNNWHRDTKSEYNRLPFKPNQIEDDSNAPFRLASRVWGLIYDGQSEEVWNVLQFPLLDEFVCYLQTASDLPSQIILLLTDQSQIFAQSDREDDKNSPYWQDTCGLEVILRRYFAEKLPGVNCVSLVLEPSAQDEGLDDWNAVLNIVDRALSTVEVEENASVYVSHQAGTPAISSAVQFTSLSRFGQQVKFLVSNEYRQDRSARTIESSTYLRGLQLQQAKALLDRYDYDGLMSLLALYLNPNNPQEKRLRSLLKAAKQWNLAKFSNFKRLLLPLEIAELDDFPWYWMGYESAYLAMIRCQQSNIVEALFHSFRAAEGLICNWAENKYPQYVFYDDKKSPQIMENIREIHPEYWEKIERRNENWIKELKNKNQKLQNKGQEIIPISVGLFSKTLYLLLESVRPESKKNSYMDIVQYSAKDERNQQFHRLLGLRRRDLFKAWKAEDIGSWEDTMLGCLNFICEREQNVTSLQEASLMARVHQELVNTIDALHHSEENRVH